MVGSSMLLVLPFVAGLCRSLLLPLALLLVSACAQVCCKSLRVYRRASTSTCIIIEAVQQNSVLV